MRHHPPPPVLLPLGLGRASTGLCGPYTAPPAAMLAWARENNALRHRDVVHPTPEGDGLYVLACAPPLDKLRTLTRTLAQTVWQRSSQGDSEALFALFGRGGRGRRAVQAWVDWAGPLPAADTLAARGLIWVAQARARIDALWTQWQHQALGQDRWFPPPQTLRARLWRDGRVQVEVAFTPGYLPGNAWLVQSIDAAGQALDAGDLVPAMAPRAGHGPINRPAHPRKT